MVFSPPPGEGGGSVPFHTCWLGPSRAGDLDGGPESWLSPWKGCGCQGGVLPRLGGLLALVLQLPRVGAAVLEPPGLGSRAFLGFFVVVFNPLTLRK